MLIRCVVVWYSCKWWLTMRTTRGLRLADTTVIRSIRSCTQHPQMTKIWDFDRIKVYICDLFRLYICINNTEHSIALQQDPTISNHSLSAFFHALGSTSDLRRAVDKSSNELSFLMTAVTTLFLISSSKFPIPLLDVCASILFMACNTDHSPTSLRRQRQSDPEVIHDWILIYEYKYWSWSYIRHMDTYLFLW